MNLYLLRHAESHGNASGNYSVAIADSLSARGESQASALATGLRAWTFDRIIVSPLTRAQQTIAPYLEATDQRAEIWPEIAEACWDDEREESARSWRSRPATLSVPPLTHFAYRDGEAIRPTHPESFGEGLCRVKEALERLQTMASHSDQSLLMVTHGHVIREVINLMLATRSPVPFPHANCGLTLMSFHDGWTMEFCNRTMNPLESVNSE